MTDKEQIIIDGVDVSKCEFYMHYDYGKFSHGCSLHKDMFGLPVCCDIADCCKDCYFKQLARKTQECEELKSQIETYSKMLDSTEFRVALTDVRTGEREVWRELGSKAQRYEQALNNIKNYIYKQECENCEKDRSRCISCKTPKDILDIINKAKGEIMEIT